MNQNTSWVVQVQGTSMRPFLESGDYALIKPCPIKESRIGDIIALTLQNNNGQKDKLCVHRLVWKKVQNKYINIVIKGDSVSSLGRVCLGRNSDYLGKVVGIVRDDKITSLENHWPNLMRLFLSFCLIPWQMMRGH